jgi:hypothetical protein
MGRWLTSVMSGLTSKPDPAPVPQTIKHAPMQGHISVERNYPRTQKAECGQYVYVREMAPHIDRVTCPKCLARLAALESAEI